METKKITISLPKEIIEKTKEFCEEKGYSLSGIIRISLEEKMKGTSETMQELMMESIRTERDQAIKQAEVDAQKERDTELLSAMLDNKLDAMEKNMIRDNKPTASKIKDLKEEIAAVKEISVLLGAKEKETGEMLMDSIGEIAESIRPELQKRIEKKLRESSKIIQKKQNGK